MKSLRPPGGYTIVEVLIVLAVTGGLLISAMTLISGQQRSTEFTTTARDFESKLQDIFNDVETGYYTSNEQLSCTNDGPAYNGPNITASATSLGTNEGCVFLGKALRFFRGGDGLTTYEVYTIAGKRQWLNGTQIEDVTTLAQANPKLFYDNSTNSPFDAGVINGALNIREIRFITSYSPFASTSLEGLAILSGVAAKDSSGKDIAAVDNRAYLASVNLSPGSPAFQDRFNDFRAQVDSGPSGMTAYPQGVVMCLSEGAGGRVAAIGIGVTLDAGPPAQPRPTGNRLATELFLDNNASSFGCTS